MRKPTSDNIPRPVRGWLSGLRAAGLGRALTRAVYLAELGQRLQKGLPESLAGRWQLADVGQEQLTVTVESAAWATQLRYTQTLLLDEAEKALGFRPRRLRIRAGSYQPVPRPRLFPAPTMSQDTIQLIGSVAQHTDDARLRDALARLARAGERTRGKRYSDE